MPVGESVAPHEGGGHVATAAARAEVVGRVRRRGRRRGVVDGCASGGEAGGRCW